jgi:lysophospholipase L1-like esterase
VNRSIQWGLAGLGVLTAAGTVGMAGRGQPVGLEHTVGELRVEQGQLVMPAGSYATFGTGQALTVELRMQGQTLDLTHGTLEDLHHFAHLGDRMGIHDSQGTALGRGHPQAWPDRASHVEFACRPPLNLKLDGAGVEIAEPVGGCTPAPMGLRATSEVRVEAITVDGVSVPIEGISLDPVPAGVALVGGLLSLALMGPAGFAVLLLSPAAPLVEALGLPAMSAMWLLYGAGASMATLKGPTWRRAVAAVACLLSFGMAAHAFIGTIGPIGLEANDADNSAVARVLETTLGLDAYERKVDQAVELYGPKLKARDATRPLVVTLGSSSTGGNDPRGFWPEYLGKELPDADVQTLAWGGATSWHMLKIMERLDVRADACVLFMGHNDTLQSVPGQSLASLERGEAPYSEAFVPPVPLPEAEVNLKALSQRCGVFVGMEEYSIGREKDLDAYAAMMDRMPEVVYLDAASELAARPQSQMMVDSVHPSPAGQRLLGRLVAEQLREHLE